MTEREASFAEFNCKKCDAIDSDRMVQCDKCDKWYHYECVAVNSAIADVSWSCENCSNNKEDNASNTQHVESNHPIANSTGLPRRPHATSSPTMPGEIQQKAGVINMVNGKRSGAISSKPMSTSPTFQAHKPMNFDNMRVVYSKKEQQPNASDVPTATTFFPINEIPQQNDIVSQMNLQLKMLEEQQRMQQEFMEKKYQILSQFAQNKSPLNQTATNMSSNWHPMGSPTPSQLAARQAIPKDLPQFHGDPEEWPLFISSFDMSTEVAGYSHAENLIRLQSCLKGRAKDLVRSKLMLPTMVPEIIQTLKMCFGRPEHILERLIEKARKLPPPKERLESIIEFALCVKNICSTMEACKMHTHLHNPMLVKELVDKLSTQYKLNWALHPKDNQIPIVKCFSDWMFQIADAASTVVSPVATIKHAALNSHIENTCQRDIKCFVCNSSEHKVSSCTEFKKLTINGKWEVVKKFNLCRQCLNKHRRKCFKNNDCGIDGCSAKHHQLLHNSNKNVQQRTTWEHVATLENTTSSNAVNSHNSMLQNQGSLFRILPIRIQMKNGFLKTFAFLDEGSSVTLIERKLFDMLEIEGVKEPLCLKWTGDTTRVEDSSIKASIKVANPSSGVQFVLKGVHTIDDLDLPTQSLDMEEMVRKYPHLTGIPIESYKNAKPSILIGADNWNIAIPLRVREGIWHQPIATKTRIGWTIQGANAESSKRAWLNIHSCNCEKKYDELHQLIKESFNLESPKQKTMLSQEDHDSIKILKATCQKVGDRYEVGLLWKNNFQNLPESYNNAYKRLMCLKKKCQKDKNLKIALQQQIENLLQKGYAKKLTASEISSSANLVWYLPTFLIANPNKPGKIRMVWDAAAKSNGVCLNDFIHRGPDLLKSLVDILVSFRVGKVAICGDIEEMFHRINVRKQDIHAQRFLWWDEDDDEQPSVYVMRALTFGICCAPCIAHYVRDYNAEQFKSECPRAVEAIQQYHYVDDFIDSVADAHQAIELATQVKRIHSAGGFHIRNWASNDTTVMKFLTNDLSPEQKPKDLANTEKVLGMHWDPHKDSFVYIFRFARLRRDVFKVDAIPTKRELLQVLMSIFDPLGFLSCYTTSLKILLQEVWRSSIDWDTQINDSQNVKWQKWKALLNPISTLQISRCYCPRLEDAVDVQLHTFVDAGAEAYAAVCYLRVAYQNTCSVTLVAGKSKVAPLKPTSIPRLELQAAVVGVRLAQVILKNQRLKIASKTFWSDSKTVIQWLRMDPKKFQQFVMHRVGEILEDTNVSQWRWVPSKENPADLATKDAIKRDSSIWFDGPKFLQEDETRWPICTNLGECINEEMKHNILLANKINSTIINYEYFSSWRRLYRAVATFLLYMDKLKAKCTKKQLPENLSYEMIQKAKNVLFRLAQESEFSAEIRCLKKGKPLENKSKLICFNTFLDNEGILRVRGRASYLNDQNPIILPTRHYVTVLLVRYTHEAFHHISHETVINTIKVQYYIPQLRILYKSIRQLCQYCKNASVMPRAPQMSSLPPARLASFERPFTYVGIDYFGPLYVNVGRRKEKRWGVLFTCLTVRAIHVEIAHSLDTSSCVMCINNFIARRGTPQEIYTDNGTNFKATSKIFASESKQLDLNAITKDFDGIKWKFNPPAAPHMGGAWERLVRSIKNTLSSICPNMNFNDETLRSAMAEAECIINSRPLTFVSLDTCDDEALTPNHLLLGSSTGHKTTVYQESDLRLRWRQTQEFTKQFWRRWIKEYLPMLTKRCKWFQKTDPLQIGDIVIIVDENQPRHCWPKGKIINTIVSKDGQVRQVTVQTQNGVLQRPTVKIAKLDVGKNN